MIYPWDLGYGRMWIGKPVGFSRAGESDISVVTYQFNLDNVLDIFNAEDSSVPWDHVGRGVQTSDSIPQFF